MKKNNQQIKLPRPYLSWSQMNLWEQNPELYKEVYIYGRENYPSEYLELGKEMAEALEKGKSKNPIIKHLLIFLPKYPKVEYEIKAKLGDIPLLGRFDGYNPRKKIIGEFKTGVKWTQGMADKSDQLTFYALLIWLKYKKLPNEILLHWVKTENKDGELKLTGDIKTFRTKRSLSEILRFSARIKKCWAGINELCRQEK